MNAYMPNQYWNNGQSSTQDGKRRWWRWWWWWVMMINMRVPPNLHLRILPLQHCPYLGCRGTAETRSTGIPSLPLAQPIQLNKRQNQLGPSVILLPICLKQRQVALSPGPPGQFYCKEDVKPSESTGAVWTGLSLMCICRQWTSFLSVHQFVLKAMHAI